MDAATRHAAEPRAANIEPQRVRRFYTGFGMQEVGALYRLPLPHRRSGNG